MVHTVVPPWAFLNSFLEALMTSLPEYVFWKDQHSRYLGCNQRFAELVGLRSPAEIIDKTDYDLPWQVQGDQAELFRQGDQATLSNQPLIGQEEVLALPGREPLLVSVSKIPLHDAQGQLLGVLGLAVDMTAQKKMEQALKNAQAKAQLAEQAKTDFLANIRHDLRTPCAALLGFLEVWASRCTTPAQQAELQAARSAGQEFLSRLQQISTFTQEPSALPPPVVRIPFAPAVLLEEIAAEWQPLAEQQDLSFVLEGLEALPKRLPSDRWRCREVVSHLLRNAIQFTPQGSITLRTRCYPSTAEGTLWEIQVIDTGIGISAEQQQTIFEPFTRLHPAYQHSTTGTGLGLTLAQRYAQELGGTLCVTSQVGQGSCFTCTLPCLSLTTLPPVRPRCLLVEDHRITANMLCMLLAPLALVIDVASSIATAKAHLCDHAYDLMLLDIGLPDGSGLEVASFLRESPDAKTAATPIVVLSAHLDDMLSAQYLQAGIQQALVKPLTVEQAQQLLHIYGLDSPPLPPAKPSARVKKKPDP